TGLRTRLGEEATVGLLELLESTENKWSERVLSIATERFERRLTQEISGLRVEIAQSLAMLRTEMHEGFARTRVEILRWSFLFGIGQVAAMAGLMAFMLRVLTGR